MEPALGCQIAPIYEAEHVSESDSDSSSEGEESPVGNRQDIEKVETQQDVARALATRPTTLQKARTKSNRAQAALAPVGFWHWSMAGVRLHVLKLFLRTSKLFLLITASKSQELMVNQTLSSRLQSLLSSPSSGAPFSGKNHMSPPSASGLWISMPRSLPTLTSNPSLVLSSLVPFKACSIKADTTRDTLFARLLILATTLLK